jgi:hypothetical protein
MKCAVVCCGAELYEVHGGVVCVCLVCCAELYRVHGGVCVLCVLCRIISSA